MIDHDVNYEVNKKNYSHKYFKVVVVWLEAGVPLPVQIIVLVRAVVRGPAA